MADLGLIKRLNNQYGKSSPIVRETKLFAINEAVDPDNLQKAIKNSIASLGPEFTRYFDLGLPADVVLLFIDVCDFSTRLADLKGTEIGEYFDLYYDIIIPTIYKYGGEIDKIIGDGIVCVFGPPFQNQSLLENISHADSCAREIIQNTQGNSFSSKVAIHSGTINYFKNKSGLYKEFTLIGKPLTELFRLESISKNEQINFFENGAVFEYYKNLIQATTSNKSDRVIHWTQYEQEVGDLKGVEYDTFYSIAYNH